MYVKEFLFCSLNEFNFQAMFPTLCAYKLIDMCIQLLYNKYLYIN